MTLSARLAFGLLGLTAAGAIRAADPEVTILPAQEIRFPTEAGKYYQLESSPADSDQWQAEGLPVLGTGEVHFVQRRAQENLTHFRVRQLTHQWVPVWADEFEGDRLDPAKWSREENGYGGGNNERQFYSTDPKYAYVKDGMLHIAAYRDPHTTVDGKTQPYSSGRIRTLERGDWQYGRFEIRAKVPGGEGIWPAVWMLPSTDRYGTWAASGEIDILESRGSNVHEALGTLHFGGKWPNNRFKGETYRFPKANAAEDFHVYALEWEADEIRWFVDGELYQTRKKEEWDSESAPDNPRAPFDQPFHLIINLAVDGGFFAGTDQKSDRLPDSEFPQVFLLDYVRVFQWAE